MGGDAGIWVTCLDVFYGVLGLEAYSAAGKTHPHEKVENQKEHAI